jgi:hypothetical protein
MITLNYNFAHSFNGKVSYRRLGTGSMENGHLHFNSEGSQDFAIPIPINTDGRYRLTLDWQYEDRDFSYHSDFLVRSGHLCAE